MPVVSRLSGRRAKIMPRGQNDGEQHAAKRKADDQPLPGFLLTRMPPHHGPSAHGNAAPASAAPAFGAWMFSASSAMPAGRCGTGEASCDIFTGAPHTPQNFASSDKGFPHFEQNIISTPLACRRQKQPQLIFHPILPEPTKKRPTQSGSFQKIL